MGNFDLQKARMAVEKAKQAVRAAERRFDFECGPTNTEELIKDIKETERRLADAYAQLSRLQDSVSRSKG